MQETNRTSSLEGILAELTEGLQILDPDYRYAYLNPAAARHGRRPAEELLGRTMVECYPGIESSGMFRLIEAAMQGGGPFWLVNEFQYPDGTWGTFELRISRIPEGVAVVSTDITERRRLEAHVQRVQRAEALGQLSGGIAHDLNNLLTIIQIHSSFVMSTLPEESGAAQDVEQVLAATRRAAELARKILTFSRPTSANAAARGVSIHQGLTETGELLARVLGSRIRLQVECPDDIGHAWIDPTALDQVIVNLSINSRDAMPDGGQLLIEAERARLEEGWPAARGQPLPPGDYIVISVTDTGQGISPELQQRIFEPFFTTRETSGGTGLGLATCWSLAASAGGTMTVYSEVGVGSTFRVYLPASPSALPTGPLEPDPAPPAGQGERILVVEDHPQVREILQRLLREAGYTVHVATDGRQALAEAARLGPHLDLLLADVGLPDVSGNALTNHLRAQHPDLPVLLLSGFPPRALRLTGYPVLTKPFSPSRLLCTVHDLLQKIPG